MITSAEAPFLWWHLLAVYFVMDLALGGDLRYHLTRAKGKKLSESITKFYAAQLILALEHM